MRKPSTFSTASCGTIKYGKKALIDAVTASIVDASSSSSFVAQPLELRLHQLLRGGRRLDLRPAGVARCRREGGDTTLATELLHYFIFSIPPPAHLSTNLDPCRPGNPFGVALHSFFIRTSTTFSSSRPSHFAAFARTREATRARALSATFIYRLHSARETLHNCACHAR